MYGGYYFVIRAGGVGQRMVVFHPLRDNAQGNNRNWASEKGCIRAKAITMNVHNGHTWVACFAVRARPSAKPSYTILGTIQTAGRTVLGKAKKTTIACYGLLGQSNLRQLPFHLKRPSSQDRISAHGFGDSGKPT